MHNISHNLVQDNRNTALGWYKHFWSAVAQWWNFQKCFTSPAPIKLLELGPLPSASLVYYHHTTVTYHVSFLESKSSERHKDLKQYLQTVK